MAGVRNLLRNAVLAAVYVVLTVGLEAFSYGPVQVRVSEALTLLAFCSPHYVPGLVLGCFLANIMSPFGVTVFSQAFFPIFIIVRPHRHHGKFPTFISRSCQDAGSTTASCRMRACSIR